MSDILSDYDKPASQSLTEDTDVESAEAVVNPLHNIPPFHPRTAPFLFPTLADLPGLLVPSIGPIFRTAAQIQHLRTRFNLPNLDDSFSLVSASPDDKWNNSGSELNDTLPEIVETIEANVQFPDPIQHTPHRSDTLLFTDGIREKQVITSELETFITSHQKDRKNKKRQLDEDDEASLSADDESKLVAYRRGVYFVLFSLLFIGIANLTWGIYLLMTS